jgi:hypothetical protein
MVIWATNQPANRLKSNNLQVASLFIYQRPWHVMEDHSTTNYCQWLYCHGINNISLKVSNSSFLLCFKLNSWKLDRINIIQLNYRWIKINFKFFFFFRFNSWFIVTNQKLIITWINFYYFFNFLASQIRRWKKSFKLEFFRFLYSFSHLIFCVFLFLFMIWFSFQI